MLAIVRNAIDDGPYPFAREARVESKHGTYRETFEVHVQMVFQIREALFRPVFMHIIVTPVSSTVGAEFGVIFVEALHSLISPRHFTCAQYQVANEGLVEKFLQNLGCFHMRHVAIRLPHQMHES